MIYLDASALVTLLSGRRPAAELRAFLARTPGIPLATSTIGFVETVRTLDRVGSFPTLMADLVRDVSEILVTEEVRDAAAQLPSGCRTLDSIHVASAQVVGENLLALVSYDRRMLEVAAGVGVPTAAPGLSGECEKSKGSPRCT
ncbi:MAG: type II toxin-antitoxin system VapC family toxin [Kineosporiaceae bacterium]|nr:type II toxin-antitoxin system VapC family toxin [Kineosporiaceae bacterium]